MENDRLDHLIATDRAKQKQYQEEEASQLHGFRNVHATLFLPRV
jgi:hypothetical protein